MKAGSALTMHRLPRQEIRETKLVREITAGSCLSIFSVTRNPRNVHYENPRGSFRAISISDLLIKHRAHAASCPYVVQQ